MKKIFMFLLILMVIFGARYFFDIYQSRTPSITTQIDTNIKTDDEVFPAGTKWLDLEMDYPKENLKESGIVKSEIFKDYYSWASQTKILSVTTEEKAKEMMIQDGMQYEYNASYIVASGSDYLSYVYDIYTYTGGAHGSVSKKVFTFDKNQTLKILNISDESIKKVLPSIRADIKKQMIERGQLKESEIDTRWLSEGTEVKKENYQIFWYQGDDIVFYFGQYQVAPYAYGEFEVKIPIKSL